MTLTEQWKKGELEVGEYYLRYKDGTTDREYYDYANVYDLIVEKGFSTESCDISEVLAPVPSYEEWQNVLNIDFNNEVLRLENAKLKELLKECRYMILAYSINHDTFTKEKVLDTVKQITNAIGEK